MATPLKSPRGTVDIIFILVILVLAAGLGGYVYYQQRQANNTYNSAGRGVTVTKNTKSATTTSSTPSGSYAGWLSYSNTKLGFSVKYPSNWYLDATSDNQGGLTVLISEVPNSEVQKNLNNLSAYNNDLQLALLISATPVPAQSFKNTDSVIRQLKFGNKTYDLIGNTFDGKVTEAALEDCDGSMNCTNWVPTQKGGSVDARIGSVANTQAATVPMDLNSTAYQTAQKILEGASF